MFSDHEIQSANGPPTDRPGILETREERKAREAAEKLRRDEESQKTQTDAQAIQAKSNVVIACLTAALVISSAIGGFVSYWQFQATKSSADSSEKAAETADAQALPAVWSDAAGFKAAAAKLGSDATVAQNATDTASFNTALKTLQGDCGGCHKVYRAQRAPAPTPPPAQ